MLAVSLLVGRDHARGEPVPRNPARIVRFVLVSAATGVPPAPDARAPGAGASPDGTPVVGREGADPAGLVRLSAPGACVIGYRSNRAWLELEPLKFEAYLREEGLDAVLAARAETGRSGEPGREVYSRCAKALLRVQPLANASDPPAAGAPDRALGFPLELLAERNPYQMRAGDSLPVRLTYNDAPLAGALVVAFDERHPYLNRRVRADQNGRTAFKIDEPGPWLVKAVHMVPAPAGSNADWESLGIAHVRDGALT